MVNIKSLFKTSVLVTVSAAATLAAYPVLPSELTEPLAKTPKRILSIRDQILPSVTEAIENFNTPLAVEEEIVSGLARFHVSDMSDYADATISPCGRHRDNVIFPTECTETDTFRLDTTVEPVNIVAGTEYYVGISSNDGALHQLEMMSWTASDLLGPRPGQRDLRYIREAENLRVRKVAFRLSFHDKAVGGFVEDFNAIVSKDKEKEKFRDRPGFDDRLIDGEVACKRRSNNVPQRR